MAEEGVACLSFGDGYRSGRCGAGAKNKAQGESRRDQGGEIKSLEERRGELSLDGGSQVPERWAVSDLGGGARGTRLWFVVGDCGVDA